LNDNASAATSDQGAGHNEPIIMFVFLILALVCIILWKMTEEALLLYGTFIFAALALVTYYF